MGCCDIESFGEAFVRLLKNENIKGCWERFDVECRLPKYLGFTTLAKTWNLIHKIHKNRILFIIANIFGTMSIRLGTRNTKVRESLSWVIFYREKRRWFLIKGFLILELLFKEDNADKKWNQPSTLNVIAHRISSLSVL